MRTHVCSLFDIDREVRLGPVVGGSNSFAVSLSQLLCKPGQPSSPPREAVHEPAHIHISRRAGVGHSVEVSVVVVDGLREVISSRDVGENGCAGVKKICFL